MALSPRKHDKLTNIRIIFMLQSASAQTCRGRGRILPTRLTSRVLRITSESATRRSSSAWERCAEKFKRNLSHTVWWMRRQRARGGERSESFLMVMFSAWSSLSTVTKIHCDTSPITQSTPPLCAPLSAICPLSCWMSSSSAQMCCHPPCVCVLIS